ncbi:MAG: exopolysaccharide biosynthesis protein [Verrucomicrobia bacterium]|nr:exopolysaccharide biosynthesis protein [Verrucomicrobiota bacterium]
MATDAAPDLKPATPGPLSPIAAAAPDARRRLSAELELIVREFDVETVTLGEVLRVLHGRGFVLLALLLSLPFITPIALPGLSTPLGLIIALIGVRLSLGQKPRLPAHLLDRRLPPATFRRVFALTRRVVLALETLLRPRLLWVTASARREQLHAISMVLCAVMLLLPLPVPFSNVIPAWAILLLAGGLLERDGAFILVGHVATLLALAFFAAIGLLGVEVVDVIWRWARELVSGAGAS